MEKTEDEVYKELEAFEKMITDSIDVVISKLGATAKEDFDTITYDCRITNVVTVTDKPEGKDQDEQCGVFTRVFVQQWNDFDNFSGFIYAKFSDTEWLKIPYEC